MVCSGAEAVLRAYERCACVGRYLCVLQHLTVSELILLTVALYQVVNKYAFQDL